MRPQPVGQVQTTIAAKVASGCVYHQDYTHTVYTWISQTTVHDRESPVTAKDKT